MALGVGIAWAIKVVGGILLALIGIGAMQLVHGAVWPLLALSLVPLLASVALAVWMIVKGRRRTGIGILIGIGTIWAVQLLLVAACFGIVLMSLGH